MKHVLFVLGLFLLSLPAFAQEYIIKENWWMDFSGEWAGEPFMLSLNSAGEGNVVGTYCDASYDEKVRLEGTESDGHLQLDARVKDTLIGKIEGHIDSETQVFSAGFVPVDEHVVIPLELQYSTGSYGTPDSRYADFAATDVEVEAFAAQIKQALQTRDYAWLAQNLAYPFNTSVKTGKNIVVKSASEFEKRKEEILPQTLVEKSRTWQTCNLWSNHNGVMLGNGEIWIKPTPLANTALKISNIHAY